MEAEIRNETEAEASVILESIIYDHQGMEVGCFSSEEVLLPKAENLQNYPPLSITPKDAYKKEGDYFKPLSEKEVQPTMTDSVEVSVVKSSATISELRFWSPDEDRKSTRLNSSHVAISYAVFCLK